MVKRLSGKVALITGAASGIGAATARLFAKQGAQVVVCDVQDEKGRTIANDIRRDGGIAEYLPLDVSVSENWRQAVGHVAARFGALTSLVNCAGVYSPTGLEQETEEGWNRVVSINQKGVWLGMQISLPELIKSGNGSIVNIASVAGMVGSPTAIAYHASKGAVRLMTKSVALEYARRAVRINAICPGMINTPMSAGASDEASLQFAASIPLGRAGEPDDIAYCALYLCSDEAKYVTGADFVVDGGVTAM